MAYLPRSCRGGSAYTIRRRSLCRRQVGLVDRVHGNFVPPWTAKLRKNGYELRPWGQTLVKRREGDEMASRFVRHAEMVVSREVLR
jgi:hypothetical protein